MAWLEYHKMSESLAYEAENFLAKAKDSYFQAAKAEERALKEIDIKTQNRTFGITAVSAIALYTKASANFNASTLANYALGLNELPDFARKQIEEMLRGLNA